MSYIAPERVKRIKKIKKILVVSNFSVIVILFLLCVFFAVKAAVLDKQLDELKLKTASQDISGDKDKYSGEEETSEADSDGKETEQESSSDEITVNPEEIYSKTAYLTFDDGPSSNTEKILDVLDYYNVNATFFVNGKDEDGYDEKYRMIVERGNAIGLHSYSHVFEDVYKSEESFAADTEKLSSYIKDVTGVETKLYRFPGGSSTTKTVNIEKYIDYLNENGYIYFDWNVSGGDAVPVSLAPEQIVENVMNGVEGKDRVIILLHDAAVRDTTVEALPVIIERLINDGYAVLPIVKTTTTVHHTVN